MLEDAVVMTGPEDMSSISSESFLHFDKDCDF